MSDLVTILQHTPAWVYLLFCALLALGLISLRTRTVKVWRLLVAPAVFIVWGVYGLAVRLDASALIAVYWVSAAAISSGLAWYGSGLEAMEPDPAHGSVRVAGSAFPLARNMSLFFAKYTVAVAIAQATFDIDTLYALDVVISGVSLGYFAGWLLSFSQRYQRAKILTIQA